MDISRRRKQTPNPHQPQTDDTLKLSVVLDDLVDLLASLLMITSVAQESPKSVGQAIDNIGTFILKEIDGWFLKSVICCTLLRENDEGENYLCERANFGERRRKRESSEVQ